MSIEKGLSTSAAFYVGGSHVRKIYLGNTEVANFTDISVDSYGVLPENTATQNGTALIAMRDALIADDRYLHRNIDFPAGIYQYDNNRWLSGLTDVTLTGYGASLQCTGSGKFIGDYNVIGPREGIFRGNGDLLISGSSYIVETGHTFGSVSAGDTSITLDNAEDAGNYQVGGTVFLHGFATQRAGYSPNLRFFEWATISAISGATITFTESLSESYDEDWPDFLYLSARTVGSLTVANQYVGKPRIISLSGRLQADGSIYYYPERVEIAGFRLLKNPNIDDSTSDRFAVSARHVVYRDLIWEDTNNVSLDMREAQTAEMIDCTLPRGCEVDKLLGAVSITGGQIGNNPENNQGINAGTGVNTAILSGVVCESKISIVARDSLVVTDCTASSINSANSANQGPLMPSNPSKFAGVYAEYSGNSLTKLSAQSSIGEDAREWSYTVDEVDNSDGTLIVPWSNSSEPPQVLRRLWPGRLCWLASDARVRGRVVSVKDQGDGTVKIAFSSGNLPLSIKYGTITASAVLNGPVVERVILDDTLWNDLVAQQSPPVGLLNWEGVTLAHMSGTSFTLGGVALHGDGSGSVDADILTFPDILQGGRSYTLSYNCAYTSGSIIIRAGGAVDKATINTSATGGTITFVADNTGVQSLTIRAASFDGSFTALGIVEN